MPIGGPARMQRMMRLGCQNESNNEVISQTEENQKK
jgi:hypothetical protein